MRDLSLGGAGVTLAATPGVLALPALILTRDASLWSNDWGWAWSMWAVQTVLVAPVLAALACWAIVDAFRGGKGTWYASGSRRRVAILRRLLPVLGLGGGTLLWSALYVSWLAGDARSPGGWAAAAAVDATAVCIGAIALGALLGRMWRHVAAPGVAVVLVWGLTAVGDAVPRVGQWLFVGGASIPLYGFLPEWDLAAQRLSASMVLAALAVVIMDPRPVRAWPSGASLSAGGLVVATAATLIGSGWFVPDHGRRDLDPAASASVCTTVDGVRTCLIPSYRDDLRDVATALAALSSAEQRLGLEGPAAYRQPSPHELLASGLSGRDGEVLVELAPGAQDPGLVAALSSLQPPACGAVWDEDPERWIAAYAAAELWVRRALDRDYAAVEEDPALREFLQLDSETQDAWLRSAVPALRVCELPDAPSAARPRE